MSDRVNIKKTSNGKLESGSQVIKLNWDSKGSNWSAWLKHIIETIETLFPLDGTFIKNNKYYEYPRPKTIPMERLPTSPANDATGEEIELYGIVCSEINQRNEENKIINNRKLQKFSDLQDGQLQINIEIWNVIWNTISPSSKDRVRQQDGFSEFENQVEKDPLKLIEHLRVSHALSKSGAEIVDQLNAFRKVVNIQIRTSETTFEFRDRLERAHEVHVAESPGSDLQQDMLAAIFFTGLDGRFNQFKLDTLNKASSGVQTFPATLDAVYTLANTHKVLGKGSTTEENRIYAIGDVTRGWRDKKSNKSKSNERTEVSKIDKSQARSEKRDTVKAATNEDQLLDRRGRPIYCRVPKPDGTECGGNHYQVNCQHMSEEVKRFFEARNRLQKEKSDVSKGQKGHVAFAIGAEAVDVEDDVSVDSNFGEAYTIANQIFAMNSIPNTHVQLLDNCCAEDFQFVNNVSLATNIRMALKPVEVGVGGAVLKLTQLCDTQYGPAYYHPECPFTIWSQAAVSKRCVITAFDNTRTLRVTRADGSTQTFRADEEFNGLMVHRTVLGEQHSSTYVVQPVAMVITVQENMKGFNKRQLDAALAAQEFRIARAAISNKNLEAIISRNLIKNLPFTLKDFKNAQFIYGPLVPGLKGKMKRKASPVMIEPERIPRTVFTDIELCIDFMFVSKLAFLIGLAPEVGLRRRTLLPLGPPKLSGIS